MRIGKKCLWDILTFPEPPFTNLVAFKRICLARLKILVERTQTPQYLAFTSVSQESLDEIVRIREARGGWLLRMTILYDGREEISMGYYSAQEGEAIISVQALFAQAAQFLDSHRLTDFVHNRVSL